MSNDIQTDQSQNNTLALPGSFDQIVEYAHRYPRNVMAAIEGCKKELDVVPGLASKSYFSIPYNLGRTNETRVEGISIWGAETLLRYFTNCVAMSKFASEDDEYIYIDGLFFDAEQIILNTMQIRGWKFYRPRDSNKILLLDPTARRNLEMACQSKIRRNAIIHSLQAWYREEFFSYAKELVIRPKAGERTKSIQERLTDGKKLLIKEFKITPEYLEEYIQLNWDAIEDDQNLLVHLHGLYRGLKDGEFHVTDGKFESKKNIGIPQEKK